MKRPEGDYDDDDDDESNMAITCCWGLNGLIKPKNFYLTTKKQQDQVQYNVFIIVEIIQI